MSDQKIKLGVIGLGMGKAHLTQYAKDDRVQVIAVADTDEERLASAKEDFNIQQTYTDVEKMLKEANLDAVSIAVPNFLHRKFATLAMENGCHVLCEKPMATSVADAEEMKKVAEKTGLNLMINFSFRFQPTSQALKAQVDAGELGDIYAGRTVWHRRRGMPGFGGWFGNKELSGGGPLIDLGVHRLDLAMWLMDYPNPVSVSGAIFDPIAQKEALRQGKSYTVEDLAMGFIRFDNGACLSIEASWAVNQKKREHMETTLYGTKGGLVQRNIEEGYSFEAELYVERNGSHFTQHLDIAADEKSTTYREFINSIVEKREPSATAEQGIKIQKVLEGLYRSASEGCEIRF